MKQELAKSYQPKDFEDRIYKMWNDSGSFTPHVDSEKQPYTIVIPPPNITGQLHMGHALDETLQDILIRWKRMSGLQHPVAAGYRPRFHCDRSQDRGSHAERGHQQRGHRQRSFSGTCMGMEEAVRRQDRRTAEKAGLLLRLDKRTLYHGRGLQQGSQGSIYQATTRKV